MTAQPKPRPKLLQKQDARKVLALLDRAERLTCRRRSGGQCEVRERSRSLVVKRCARRASQNHHLLSGSGRRNVGKSILSAHRLHVCDLCHRDITNHVLVPRNGLLAEDASSVSWERVR